MRLLEKEIRNFKYGIVDELEAQSIPDGAASASSNWLTKGDKIELRRGSRRFGSDAGVGRVSGLRVLTKQDGTEVMVRTRGRKVEFFDTATEDWIETGSDVLPAAADGEDVSIEPYNGLSGAAGYLSSPNSSIYKIMAANPGSITDLQMTDHKGRIRIKTGRTYLWDRKSSNGGKDETGLYRSKIDKDEVSDFTQITGEAVGSAGSAAYSGTLAFKAAGANRTCFLVRITDGSKTLYDDKNGGFTGDGTGTINYTTGAYSVTFNTATTGAVTASYYWEDSTSGGICDFAFSASRTAGQGYVLRQDDAGGKMQNVGFYNGQIYCLHERKTWRVVESDDDLTITNLIYRELVGVPYWRSMAESGEGVYFVDTSDRTKPVIRLLTLEPVSAQVVPVSISNNVNLEAYEFDRAAGHVFGDWVLFACRTASSVVNDTVIVYDRKRKSLDKLDYRVSCFETYEGACVAGASDSNNVYELFSGFDDDDANIPNSWEGNLTRLGLQELKKVKRLRLQGEIGPDQAFDVYLSLDRGPAVKIGTVEGSGSYVDRTQVALVGTATIGKNVIGGGGTGVTAYNYYCELPVKQDKFDEAKISFVATGLGYLSVSMYNFFDVRPMGQRLPSKYRT